MDRVYDRINWENEPSILTPLNATNLNKIDSAVYTIDGRVVTQETTKANQSDLLQCVKLINYDTSTGTFTFTWQNGTQYTIDLNIEKIPVTFSMDENGVITMTTADGTQYTADVGSLIKTYTFNDSSVIDFTVTTDASGNKIVTADIIDGSITGSKLEPNYLDNCQQAQAGAESAEASADADRLKSEGYAVGTQDGVPVQSGSEYYHNNAKYYSEQANVTSLVSLTDVDINNPQNNESLVYNSTTGKWENKQGGTVIDELNDIGDVNITNPTNRQALVYDATNSEWVNGSGGLLPRMVIQTEVGSTVSITNGSETITPEAQGMGIYYAELPDFDDWTVTATKDGQTSTQTVTVDTVKIYSVNASYFTAYINVTAPTGSTVTVANGTETYTQTSGYSFTVHSSGTWNITVTKTDATKSGSVSITTDGQTATATFEFASINVTYASEFSGATISATDGTHTYTRVASGTVSFDIADLGTWTISATVSGSTFSTSVEVTEYTSYNAELTMYGYQGWLDSAGITKTFSSLAEVLADEKTVRTLFTKFASVDYLVNWAQIDNASATTILNNDYCAKWINLRDYALDTLYANATIKTAMDTADKYFYGEWVERDGVWQAKGNVPIMTANNAPYGEAVGANGTSGKELFRLFTTSGNPYETQGIGTSLHAGYKSVNPICVKKVKIDNSPLQSSGRYTALTFDFKASNDGATWVTLATNLSIPKDSTSVTYYDIDNDNYYLEYQVFAKTGGDEGYTQLGRLQFYGRELKVSVPTMTSNTEPWGEVSASSYFNNSYLPYFAFNDNTNGWATTNADNENTITYDFGTDVLLRKVKLQTLSGTQNFGTTVCRIDGSSGDNVWHTVIDSVSMTVNTNNPIAYSDSTDNTPYRYYRVKYVSGISFALNRGIKVQFYGLDYSEYEERHYIYDHGVEVEEVETNIGGTIGTATKYGDNITLYRNGGSSTAYQEVVTTNSIDCTSYNLLRAVCFNLQSTLSSRYGTIGVVNSKSGRASTGVANSDIYNNIPNHINIDVSNVNAQIYPKIDLYIQNTSSFMQNLEINEMWLE